MTLKEEIVDISTHGYWGDLVCLCHASAHKCLFPLHAHLHFS